MIPQSYIDSVLSRANIVDVIDHRIRLKKAGKNHVACCPFHDERSPSFTVSEQKQMFYCFGCGKSGNVIGFIMDYDRVDFPAAVVSLGRELGLGDPDISRQPKESLQARFIKWRRLKLQISDDQLLMEIVKAARLRGEPIMEEEKPKILAAIERLKANKEAIKQYADVEQAVAKEKARLAVIDAHMTLICQEAQEDRHFNDYTQHIPRKVRQATQQEIEQARTIIQKAGRAI